MGDRIPRIFFSCSDEVKLPWVNHSIVDIEEAEGVRRRPRKWLRSVSGGFLSWWGLLTCCHWELHRVWLPDVMGTQQGQGQCVMGRDGLPWMVSNSPFSSCLSSLALCVRHKRLYAGLNPSTTICCLPLTNTQLPLAIASPVMTWTLWRPSSPEHSGQARATKSLRGNKTPQLRSCKNRHGGGTYPGPWMTLGA